DAASALMSCESNPSRKLAINTGEANGIEALLNRKPAFQRRLIAFPSARGAFTDDGLRHFDIHERHCLFVAVEECDDDVLCSSGSRISSPRNLPIHHLDDDSLGDRVFRNQ